MKYVTRPGMLGLITTVKRRRVANLIQVYKIKKTASNNLRFNLQLCISGYKLFNTSCDRLHIDVFYTHGGLEFCYGLPALVRPTRLFPHPPKVCLSPDGPSADRCAAVYHRYIHHDQTHHVPASAY